MAKTDSDLSMELAEIEICSPLNPQGLADIFYRTDSPLIVKEDGKDIHFRLKDYGGILGGGIITEHFPEEDLDFSPHDALHPAGIGHRPDGRQRRYALYLHPLLIPRAFPGPFCSLAALRLLLVGQRPGGRLPPRREAAPCQEPK